ncbi:RING/U-box superfamily protein isoform 1 [Dorcoceras hygrometricum]|uniref:RING/U-box superfamily protein isoform 1 n=1 Tax=Dorcoceras hygrometricum TaxID=472368 RepID=A0A2Z7BXG4_9LAMI|nr:RING/U-box superfamily protein isoform 1 [Dorcoceras hygrometricum]
MLQQHNRNPTIRSPNNPNLENALLSRDHTSAGGLARIHLSDLLTYDGAPLGPYSMAVDALSASLGSMNAAVIVLGPDDAALIRCVMESARFYFRTRAQTGKGPRGVYTYRAGRPMEDVDSSPPCMADTFRCMGRAARATLCAIARHLRLRSDAFNHLLDDSPLPTNEPSSSVLVATYSQSYSIGKCAVSGGSSLGCEVERGLLTLISSDSSGLQVCDPNGCWYQADTGLAPGELLLLTGKGLGYITAGLRPAASYRAVPENSFTTSCGGRTALAFRLMPQGNAILECSSIAAAGNVIPEAYVPISVSRFMDDLSAEDDALYNQIDEVCVPRDNLNRKPSLRSVLSDPLSGSFLDDAMLVSCGHSFGGLTLRRVIETSKCTLCNTDIKAASLIPNHALRAAALAVKQEDNRRLFHNAALRKRRKEVSEHRENGEFTVENGSPRALHYPFSVNEKVIIKGNRRTPDKFVGKEAVITSQCLNGWSVTYLRFDVGSKPPVINYCICV